MIYLVVGLVSGILVVVVGEMRGLSGVQGVHTWSSMGTRRAGAEMCDGVVGGS